MIVAPCSDHKGYADLPPLPPNHRAGSAHVLLIDENLELVGQLVYGEWFDLCTAFRHVPDETLDVRGAVVDLDCSKFAGALATRSAQIV